MSENTVECSIKAIPYEKWCHFCKWLYGKKVAEEKQERFMERLSSEFSHEERDGGGE